MGLVAKQPDHLMFYKPHSDAQKIPESHKRKDQ